MTMKNRKTVIAVFLVLALMLVAIGYAAISGTLTIEGTVSSTAQNFNVYFTGAKVDKINDSENDNAVPALSIQNTKVTETQEVTIANLFTVSMTATGLATTEDYIQVTYTIHNHNKVDMLLTPSVSGNTLFDVDFGFADGDDSDDLLDATTVVAAEGDTTFTVTVKLADDNLDETATENFTITIVGTSDVQ